MSIRAAHNGSKGNFQSSSKGSFQSGSKGGTRIDYDKSPAIAHGALHAVVCEQAG